LETFIASAVWTVKNFGCSFRLVIQLFFAAGSEGHKPSGRIGAVHVKTCVLTASGRQLRTFCQHRL